MTTTGRGAIARGADDDSTALVRFELDLLAAIRAALPTDGRHAIEPQRTR